MTTAETAHPTPSLTSGLFLDLFRLHHVSLA